MSAFSLTLVLQIKTSKIINDMAKVQQKSEKISAFGGIFFVLDRFDRGNRGTDRAFVTSVKTSEVSGKSSEALKNSVLGAFFMSTFVLSKLWRRERPVL